MVNVRPEAKAAADLGGSSKYLRTCPSCFVDLPRSSLSRRVRVWSVTMFLLVRQARPLGRYRCRAHGCLQLEWQPNHWRSAVCSLARHIHPQWASIKQPCLVHLMQAARGQCNLPVSPSECPQNAVSRIRGSTMITQVSLPGFHATHVSQPGPTEVRPHPLLMAVLQHPEYLLSVEALSLVP
jgi:hypothetical protein